MIGLFKLGSIMTIDEIKAWKKTGISKEFLIALDNEPSSIEEEIIDTSNIPQELLIEDAGYQVIFPLSADLEWGPADAVKIINKKTGRVITTLEQSKNFQLYKNKTITIKSRDEEKWKSITTEMQKLSQDQFETLNTALAKITSNNKGYFSKKDLSNLIAEVIKSKKRNKFRVSGQFVDSKLTPEKLPLNISPSIKIKIDESNIKVFGIKLTPSEDRLLLVLSKLNHYKSENQDTKSEKFYAGNTNGKIIAYDNGNIELPSRAMIITRAELYKEYLNKDSYSGKEILNIDNLLQSLCEKKYFIQYKMHYKKNGRDCIDRIEDVQPLIKSNYYFKELTKEENKRLDQGDIELHKKRVELIIQFNPIVTAQIDSKYIEYPEDINQRTMIASGGIRKVTESIIALRDYLMREKSARRFEPKINKTTLIEQIRLTGNKKSRIEKGINDAIDASKKLGLILECTTEIGSQDQIVFKFILNKKFE